MNYKAKLEFIGDKMKIPGFANMGLPEKSEAAKKATGKVTIEEALKYAQNGGKAVNPSKAETVTVVKEGEIIPPGTTSNVAHKVDVGAPNINVNIPAPVVTVSHGNLSWSHALRQSLLWVNGFVMGGSFTALMFLWTAVNAP